MPKSTQEQNHNTLIRVIVLAVILLTIGQVVLYKNLQNIKTMISETAIEIKEGTGVKSPSTIQYKMDDSKTVPGEPLLKY